MDKIKFFDAGTSNADTDIIIETDASYTSDWFYSWKENDLGNELNTKRAHSVC